MGTRLQPEAAHCRGTPGITALHSAQYLPQGHLRETALRGPEEKSSFLAQALNLAGLDERDPQVVLVVKQTNKRTCLPVQETVKDSSLIPGSGRSPEGEYGNPLQYSCLENPMDREAWQVTVHRVAKNLTRLKQLRFAHTMPG